MRRLLPLLVVLAAGCSTLPGGESDPLTLSPPTDQLSGLVTDLDGRPLPGATVRSATETTTSGDDGSFALAAPVAPSWVQVEAEGHLPRTEAARAGEPVLSRLTPQDGQTVSLRFGGDVMAGRRFYDRDEDGRASDALLPPDAGVAAHRALLDDVRPLLEEPDLMVVNLESPLSDEPWFDPTGGRPAGFHPTKEFVFASAPELAQALVDVGVDVVDLGNNHLYDALDEGTEDTLAALDEAGLPHYGAGADLDAAWEPARLEVRGQRFSFVGCTTITGEEHPLTYVASPERAGAAPCEQQRLEQVVAAEAATGATVVASVHGGFEYAREQSVNVRTLSQAARRAGAKLVVDHHPHVVGPIEVTEEGGLVAETLGNLLFDQQVWATFPSYLLTTDVRGGEVLRARTEPLLLEGYTPRGTVGPLADVSDRFAASEPSATSTFGRGGVEVIPGGPVRTGRAQALLEPLEVRRVAPGWSATGTSSRALQLGQELLWTGGFEDEQVEGSRGAHLWDLSGGTVSLQPDATRSGAQGIRMVASPAAQAPSLLTPLHRTTLPYGVEPVTFTGHVRGSAAAQLLAEIHWYPGTQGPSGAVLARPVRVTGDWRRFQIEATPPPGTVAAQVFLRLSPAAGDAELRVAVDDVSLVQWAPAGTQATPLHGAVRTLDTAQSAVFSARLPAGGELLPGWISGAPLLEP